MAKEFLSPKEAAAKYDLPYQTINTQLKAGKFDGALKVRGRWQIPLISLEAFFNQKSGDVAQIIEASDLQRLKAEKTFEEVKKLKLNRVDIVEKIRAGEQVEFKRLLNMIFVNMGTWPIDMKLTPEQKEIWNKKLIEAASTMERESLIDRTVEIEKILQESEEDV